MTIAAITTFGFVSSTVSLAVTLGYGAGAPPPPVVTIDTHDLPRHHVITQEQIRRYRAKVKRDNLEREKEYADKLEAANSIRLEIDRILHPPAEDFAEKTANPELKPPEALPDLPRLTAKQRARITDLKRQIGVLMAEAHILEEQRAAAVREWRKRQDEADMELIAALYNAALTQH